MFALLLLLLYSSSHIVSFKLWNWTCTRNTILGNIPNGASTWRGGEEWVEKIFFSNQMPCGCLLAPPWPIAPQNNIWVGNTKYQVWRGKIWTQFSCFPSCCTDSPLGSFYRSPPTSSRTESSFWEGGEPLLPEVCLVHVWQEAPLAVRYYECTFIANTVVQNRPSHWNPSAEQVNFSFSQGEVGVDCRIRLLSYSFA